MEEKTGLAKSETPMQKNGATADGREAEQAQTPAQAGADDGGASEAASVPAAAKWVFSVLLVGVISVLSVLLLYFPNVREVDFSEAAPLLLLFLAIGAGVFLLFLLFMRAAPKAALATAGVMLVFQNYTAIQTLVQKPFHNLGYIQFVSITVVVLLHLAYLLHRKLPPAAGFRVTQLLAIGFSAVLLVVTATSVPTLVKKVQASADTGTADVTVAQGAGGEHPNIYFLVFDEYARFDMLEKYFDYDNSAFADYLEESGFNVSYTSSNESTNTRAITANLIMLDYPGRQEDPDEVLDRYRCQGTLYQILGDLGYSMVGVGDSSFFGVPSVTYTVDQGLAATIEGTSFNSLVLDRTPLAPFTGPAFGTTTGDVLLSARDYFISTDNYGQEHNLFTMAYLSFPHQPFIFTATGGYNNSDHWNDWVDRQYYQGQLVYTTKIIQDMVAGIIKNDPGAIIIIQSDHGARGDKGLLGGDLHLPFEDMVKILNVVYYKGEPLDIDGKSGVNTLRTILSTEFGLDLPDVEVPKLS